MRSCPAFGFLAVLRGTRRSAVTAAACALCLLQLCSTESLGARPLGSSWVLNLILCQNMFWAFIYNSSIQYTMRNKKQDSEFATDKTELGLGRSAPTCRQGCTASSLCQVTEPMGLCGKWDFAGISWACQTSLCILIPVALCDSIWYLCDILFHNLSVSAALIKAKEANKYF